MAERLEQIQRAFTAYAVERELGSGGMATVYLAHDKKHERKVAIKVLRAELAALLGAERFLQEIRVTANLQHPHILGLIDSGILGEGELQGRPYYVMPYVKGESLRQRLDKEQQLPVSDGVRIAAEVASALDYAHRQGVIHRDVKPENILLHDDSAIVADFGIALAVTQAGGARITQTGVSLGTPSYMSPEQALGEGVITARSDIYSLGAVTYEMLSGELPFTGATGQAVLARVMTEEPRLLSVQRRSVPPNVAAAVSHALERIPADRFASANEFAEALKNPSFASSAKPTSTAAASAHDGTPFRLLFYAAASVAVLFIGIAGWAWTRQTPSKQVLRYTLVFDSTEALGLFHEYLGRVAISPDGSHLAYVGGPGRRLLVRSRDQLHATPISGSDHAYTPFFSPDSKKVGFGDDKGLRIASLDGRPVITVSDSSVLGGAGATWGRDGFIYVDAAGPTLGGGLLRIEAKAGAQPGPFTALDTASGESDHIWPKIVPNGKAVLITVVFSVMKAAQRGSMFSIAVAEIPSGKHRVVIKDGMNAVYATSGHLLYVNSKSTLMAVGFDQNSLRVIGEPTALAEGLRTGTYGSTDLAVSETGTLLYATGGGSSINELVWVTRTGRARPVDPDWQANFSDPALSPDGKQLAVSITNPDGSADIWVKKLDRGPSIKLTVEGGSNVQPTWMADGQSVSYASDAAGLIQILTRRADASTPAVPQLREKRQLYSPVWSNDGKWLLCFTDFFALGAGDILGFRPGVDTSPVPLIASKFGEASPALSPDGRWLAYTSLETGRPEVYVVPFPNVRAGKWALSKQGGRDPQWSRSGKEVFFRDGPGNLVATEVATTPAFSVGPSTTLFPTPTFWSDYSYTHPQYSVEPGDRRFLLVRARSGTKPDKLILVDNWFKELERIAGK